MITEHLPTQAEEVIKEFLNLPSESFDDAIIPARRTNGRLISSNVAVKCPMIPPVVMVLFLKKQLMNKLCSFFFVPFESQVSLKTFHFLIPR